MARQALAVPDTHPHAALLAEIEDVLGGWSCGPLAPGPVAVAALLAATPEV